MQEEVTNDGNAGRTTAEHGGMRTALIVDDEPAMRLLLQDYLELLGFQSDLAENGATAIEKGARTHYEVALVDLKLPDLTGIEVIARLRALGSRTRFIVVSGNLREPYEKELAALGVRYFLEKPVVFELLREALSPQGPGGFRPIA